MYICQVRQRHLWSGSLTFFNLPDIWNCHSVLNPVSPSLQLSLSIVSTGLHSEAHVVLISLTTQASLVPTSSRPLRHHPSQIPGFLCPLECSLHPSLFVVSFQCILIMSMTNYYRRIIAQRIRAGTVGVFGEQPSVPRPDPSWSVSTDSFLQQDSDNRRCLSRKITPAEFVLRTIFTQKDRIRTFCPPPSRI